MAGWDYGVSDCPRGELRGGFNQQSEPSQGLTGPYPDRMGQVLEEVEQLHTSSLLARAGTAKLVTPPQHARNSTYFLPLQE